MKSNDLDELLEEFLNNSSTSAVPLLDRIDDMMMESTTRAGQAILQLQHVDDWLRTFFEDNRPPISSSASVEQLKTRQQALCKDLEQVDVQMKAIKSLRPIVDSMILCLQNLHRDESPAEALQGYFVVRRELLKAVGAEWAVAAEEKLTAMAQRLNAMFLTCFSSTPLRFLDLLLATEGDMQPIQNFMKAFYARLLAETLAGRGELQLVAVFKLRAQNALEAPLAEQISVTTERVLSERAETLARLSLSGSCAAEDLDRLVDCAIELGFDALAASAQSQCRLREHSESLNRLRAPKALFAAFFEQGAISANEFIVAFLPLIPSAEGAEEQPGPAGQARSRAIAREYALAFFRLLRFLLERHLAAARHQIPSASFTAIIRAAAGGVLGFGFPQRATLFAQFAEIEFRWLRMCA